MSESGWHRGLWGVILGVSHDLLPLGHATKTLPGSPGRGVVGGPPPAPPSRAKMSLTGAGKSPPGQSLALRLLSLPGGRPPPPASPPAPPEPTPAPPEPPARPKVHRARKTMAKPSNGQVGAPDAWVLYGWVAVCRPPQCLGFPPPPCLGFPPGRLGPFHASQVPEKRVSEMLHFRVSDELRSIEEPGGSQGGGGEMGWGTAGLGEPLGGGTEGVLGVLGAGMGSLRGHGAGWGAVRGSGGAVAGLGGHP